jgi:inorganic pyrophosphatase
MPLPTPHGLHPWHDIRTGRRPPDELTAVIEIPTNECNKYELDKTLGIYRLDRVLHSAVHYPGDYGWSAVYRGARNGVGSGSIS